MAKFQVRTAAEQFAEHLRGELIRGKWGGQLPGSASLAAEFGIGHGTIDSALTQLEKAGLLESQGAGRPRRIVMPAGGATPNMRVAILLYRQDTKTDPTIEELFHRLLSAGHNAFYAKKSLLELRMDPGRVARFVKRVEADAWIVAAGSREVLKWFAERETPAFALFGIRAGLPIAGIGPELLSADREVIRRLIELGHRRIVSLSNLARPDQSPSLIDQGFLNELAAHGLPASAAFNLPKWKNTPEGYRQCLDSIFAVTPPTALVAESSHYFIAAHQYCLERGLRVPQDVSMVCREPVPIRILCTPATSHVRWDYHAMMNPIVRWTNNVARGRDDRRQTHIKADFIEGGTIGPVP